MPRIPQTTWPFAVEDAARQAGNHLRTARLRRNKTQSEVAGRLGVHRDTVALVERGGANASVGTLLGLMWLYGLLPGTVDAFAPDKDAEGTALENGNRRERARHGMFGLDNDF